MTGPLYCCSFIAKRTTEWRLKPLRGVAIRSVERRACRKSNTLGSMSVSCCRAWPMAQSSSRQLASLGAVEPST
jgi:hypothetical protein